MTNSVDLQQPSCKDVDNSMQQQIATAGVVPSTDTASNDTCMLADNNGSSRQQSSNISNSRSQVANRITKSVENDPRVPNQETGSKSVSDHRRMCHTENNCDKPWDSYSCDSNHGDQSTKSCTEPNSISEESRSLPISEAETEFDELVDAVSKKISDCHRSFTVTGGYKISDKFWTDIEHIDGNVPYGHSGTAVFQLKLHEKKKVSEIDEINDGFSWKKQVLIKKEFEGCISHTRYSCECFM